MPVSGAGQPGKSTSTTERAGLRAALARFWHRSYAPDYLGFVLLEAAYVLASSIVVAVMIPS